MGVKSNTFRPGESHLNIRVWPAPVPRGIKRVQLVPWKFLSLSLSLFISKERNRVSFLRAWRNDGRFEEQPCALRREEKEEEEKKFRSGILDKPYFRLIYFARENPRFLFTPRGDNRIQVSVDDSCDANARGSVGEMKRVEMLSDRFDGFVTRLTCTKNISKDD